MARDDHMKRFDHSILEWFALALFGSIGDLIDDRYPGVLALGPHSFC
jgi:hypothetical protein